LGYTIDSFYGDEGVWTMDGYVAARDDFLREIHDSVLLPEMTFGRNSEWPCTEGEVVV
jgi:hypothetical protein